MAAISRRDMGKLLAGGAAGLLISTRRARGVDYINSTFDGVMIGAQSYSFRDMDLDAAIKAYQTIGIGECELYQGHVEPEHLSREALRHWRLTVPLAHFHAVRRKFDRAGVLLYAYNYSFRKDFTDAEYTRGFEMARALGVRYITASSNVSIAHKIDGYAQKYKIVVGFHNHDETSNPDEFSTAAIFERVLKGASRWIGINLDVGHFVAADQDPIAFLRKWHSRIVTLHLKDRKRDHGATTPWGEGDTPLVGVLRLVRDNHWKFPGNIEYEHGKPGMNTIVEVRKCFEICKRILTTGCQGKSCYAIA
jgi:sugar phosphate isomerase/epimerase